jgi:hypothetical protein
VRKVGRAAEELGVDAAPRESPRRIKASRYKSDSHFAESQSVVCFQMLRLTIRISLCLCCYSLNPCKLKLDSDKQSALPFHKLGSNICFVSGHIFQSNSRHVHSLLRITIFLVPGMFNVSTDMQMLQKL